MRLQKIKRVLRQKTVGIAGCGGLGSNAAIALARVGVGRLIIADHDVVESDNLIRQYYFTNQVGLPKAKALEENIRLANPSVNVDANVIELNPVKIVDIFSPCDLVIEALDRSEMKEMLIETVQSQLPQMPVISGVGVGGWGKNEFIHTRHSGSLHIVGDEQTESSEEYPPLAPRVGAVANLIANLALEILLGAD